MGEIIDGVNDIQVWYEHLPEFIHQSKLDITLQQFALRICEQIPTQIPEGFTLTLGTEMCELLQQWHRGHPYEPWFQEGPDRSDDSPD